MYTEEEHKKLFKRYFGKTVYLAELIDKGRLYMQNRTFVFTWYNTHMGIYIDRIQKPYTQMMKLLYGKDISVFIRDGNCSSPNFVKKVYHVPSSFEEMSIICDLNGK